MGVIDGACYDFNTYYSADAIWRQYSAGNLLYEGIRLLHKSFPPYFDPSVFRSHGCWYTVITCARSAHDALSPH